MTTYGTIPTSSDGGTNLEYLSRAKERIKTGLGTRQPWKEVLNLHSINLPHGVSEAYPRIKTNIGYFRMNYAIIVLVILFLSLLWHPISLIVFVVLMAVWLFLYFLRDEPLVILHRVIKFRRPDLSPTHHCHRPHNVQICKFRRPHHLTTVTDLTSSFLR